MNIDNIYSSYVTVEDVKENPKWVILGSKEEHSEKYNRDNIVLSLECGELKKDLTLNGTNAFSIATTLGTKETDDWVGATIEFHTPVEPTPQGRKECIRVKSVEKGKA